MNKYMIILALVAAVILIRRRSSHVPGLGRVWWSDQDERDKYKEELENE